MTLHWRFRPERSALEREIAERWSISRLAARLLVNRGISSLDEAGSFLRPALSRLADPFSMAHMERAVDRLARALSARQPILVYGDSDVDGVCGTALLTSFLRAAGGMVSTYVPNRLTEGYSLTDRGLAAIRAAGARVVITVDNGTSATARTAILQAEGVDVIVADHHVAPEAPPTAFAMLNPKWESCGYPFRWLCGTAVAFQLLAALATRLPARGASAEAMTALIRHSVALVAMATICDCVPLIGENRALARAGLEALARGNGHPGLEALCSLAGVGRAVQSDDVSFRLGPRLNAAGRLGAADRALDLLLAEDRDEARALARELDDLNQRRQALEAEILQQARPRAAAEAEAGASILVLGDPAWHAGVLGIVANRLASEFGRPAVLIALTPAGGRGSGRATRGFDLHRLLAACASHLRAFGGHAAAAGLELREGAFDAFRRDVLRAAEADPPEVGERALEIDAEVTLGALTPRLMDDVNRLSPFGESNALPLFAAGGLAVDGEPRWVGRNQSHLSFAVIQGGTRRKAIAYGVDPRVADRLAGGFDLAFTPRLNLFRGRAEVELEVKDVRTGTESA